MLGTSFPGNLPGAIGHCITKAAVIRMSEVAAIELAPLNIRVNAICPGPILTPQLAQFVGEHGENEVGQGYLAAGLADRLGRNSDVVEAAVYLASDAAEFITGVNLPVDGGFTVSGGRGRPDAAMAESFRKILAPEGS
jgi:3-oxoacyl-[acyl-carrier protein] reductase